jgi:hypothetical protein
MREMGPGIDKMTGRIDEIGVRIDRMRGRIDHMRARIDLHDRPGTRRPVGGGIPCFRFLHTHPPPTRNGRESASLTVSRL